LSCCCARRFVALVLPQTTLAPQSCHGQLIVHCCARVVCGSASSTAARARTGERLPCLSGCHALCTWHSADAVLYAGAGVAHVLCQLFCCGHARRHVVATAVVLPPALAGGCEVIEGSGEQLPCCALVDARALLPWSSGWCGSFMRAMPGPVGWTSLEVVWPQFWLQLLNGCRRGGVELGGRGCATSWVQRAAALFACDGVLRGEWQRSNSGGISN
jgi:hypothetical protein